MYILTYTEELFMRKFKKALSLILAICLISSLLYPTVFAFRDISPENPYAESIARLAEKGILKGYDSDTSGVADSITRAQFMTLLWRASGSPTIESDVSFTDVSENDWFYDAVRWARANGISKIYSDGSFAPSLPADREHAAYFLYNWSKLMKNTDTMKTASLDDIPGNSDISPESVVAFAWALEHGVLSLDGSGNINPKGKITRGEIAYAIDKILETHFCLWGEWVDKGDGTCERVCTLDPSHIESGSHIWNNGELTVAPTATESGRITYTCTNCLAQKTDTAAAGSKITTRGDLEEAIAHTALAYYAKNPFMQYDSTHLTDLAAYHGGLIRLCAQSSPELATSDRTFYSVCSDYTYQVYYEAFGIHAMGDVNNPYGMATGDCFLLSDNQEAYRGTQTRVNNPIEEGNVDACVIRYMNYDRHSKDFASRIPEIISYGTFEMPTFTDWTTGLYYKDDAYEGEVHYSYYDEDGNVLDVADVRKRFLAPAMIGEKNILRPGDFLVTSGHALLYLGNGKVIDFSSTDGGKVNTKTGVDEIETKGPIVTDKSWVDSPDEGMYKYFIKWNPSTIVATRPLEFFVRLGYDEYPENDIVKDISIPEHTLSRIRYPMLSIDRTVDITYYGTVISGENLEYSVRISNKSDDEFYKSWISAYDPTKPISSVYNDLTVTEKIPEGCELIADSITGNGEYKDGVITWKLDAVNPGETVDLKYSVKVTAKPGSVIVSDGGTVDNIPSNCIKTTVGGAKLTEEERFALAEIKNAGTDGLRTDKTGTDFAEEIYGKIGKELALPEVTEMTDKLFTLTSHIAGHTKMGAYIASVKPISMFIKQKNVAPEYKNLKSMLIDTFHGGRRFYAGVDEKWNYADNCIKEFRPEYLEAGDIIICVQSADRGRTTLTNEFAMVNVMVYDGESLLSQVASADGVTYEIIANADIKAHLCKLFMTDKDLFFALRPSQAN